MGVCGHSKTGRSNGVAAFELSIVLTEIEAIEDEAAWSQFVDDAEGAISREHSLWTAPRG